MSHVLASAGKSAAGVCRSKQLLPITDVVASTGVIGVIGVLLLVCV